MKPTFLNQSRPLITCMIQATNPTDAISMIRNAAFDGCDAYGLQVCRLAPEYQTKETLRKIMKPMGAKPCYVTNYRHGYNAGKTDDELAAGLLFLQQCGGNLMDVMGDLFCPDPMELTMDEAAIEKQMQLIDTIHARGGEVLMSSHVLRFIPAEEVLRIAKEQERRGADIIKIVTGASTEEEELENLRITTLLRKELKKPFLFLSGGRSKLHRTIGPMLGCCMWLTVQQHDALSTKGQPVCRAIRAIADNFDYLPERE